jgi:hypothetical protein
VRCHEGDIYVALGAGAPFHQHLEVRTLHAAEHVLGGDYFLDVRARLRPGHCLHVTRYVNDHWRDVVYHLAWVRVLNVTADAVTLLPTQQATETGLDGESGFVVDQATPILVRFDGRTAGTFNTMTEAREFVKRNGYAVRRESGRAVVQQRGIDVREFADVRAAWAWVSKATN